MSVFTPVSEAELTAFLREYALGELVDFAGIEEGIENTNYFVDTSEGRFVLTLFERTDYAGLPFFLGVMGHLADAGIPSARPRAGHDGVVLRRLNGRPAALVDRLVGRSVEHPTPAQCGEVAAVMGRMHRAGADFSLQRASCRGALWWNAAAVQLDEKIAEDERGLLNDEIAFQADACVAGLPAGVIHADLFRDNALFKGDRLAGLIDFYYACTGPWLYDLAVLVNDWAINATGELDEAAYAAIVAAYAGERAPGAAERVAWNAQLRAAALRFWLSRLCDLHFPRDAQMTYTKDPGEFRAILELHRARKLEL